MFAFMLGDLVSYRGSKLSQLGGKPGEIVGRVTNCPEEVVCEFGNGSYIIAESELSRFQGHLKGEPTEDGAPEKKRGGPEVKKRRPSRKEAEQDKE